MYVNSGCVFYLIGKASKKQFPFFFFSGIDFSEEGVSYGDVHDLSLES